MTKVPFFTTEPDTAGFVSIQDEALNFEWSRGGRTAFVLNFEKIKTISYDQGLIASSIIVGPREKGDLAWFPVTNGEFATIKVSRRDREIAEQLVKDVSFSLMDSQLDDMLDFTDL